MSAELMASARPQVTSSIVPPSTPSGKDRDSAARSSRSGFFPAHRRRDGAIASAKLKHFISPRAASSKPRGEVRTKFSKSFMTFFFPVGYEVRQIVLDWIWHLRSQRKWENDDPLFPATRMAGLPARLSSVIDSGRGSL